MNKFFLSLALFFALGVFIPVTVSAQGIEFFQGTWEQAVEKAKKEKKIIFVDCYAVWCGPCKYMSNTVFPDPQVGEFYNKNFINYKYDMEKGDGPTFANTYNITAYPTLMYIDGTGKVIHRVLGGQYKDNFIAEGEKALKAN
ncbi:MAG: thioredoxin family protein [Chitinophagales bacterium]|nr:thioredoxin family protein [Chitinophagales bacterium]